MPTGSSMENKAILNSFGRLYSDVKYKEHDSLNSNNLAPFLTALREALADFSTQFAQHFFSYA
jgi:hypothetical protein